MDTQLVATQMRHRSWMEDYARQQESVLSVKEWCQENGISPKTFYYRVRALRDVFCKCKFPKVASKNGDAMVNEFFDWARKAQYAAAGSDKTKKGIQYCLNQEKYLRAFLDDPALPLDNNIAEQAIRPFCVGRNNWKLIDTLGGADASAIIYSIVETAKANDLNIYKYLKYILTEIPQHMDETSTDFIEALLPWSKKLPPDCRKKKASN